MRGADLEPTRALLDALHRGLRRLSNRAGELAVDWTPEHADAAGTVAIDIWRLAAIVEVLKHREDTVL
jgi:hypothetical protein